MGCYGCDVLRDFAVVVAAGLVVFRRRRCRLQLGVVVVVLGVVVIFGPGRYSRVQYSHNRPEPERIAFIRLVRLVRITGSATRHPACLPAFFRAFSEFPCLADRPRRHRFVCNRMEELLS